MFGIQDFRCPKAGKSTEDSELSGMKVSNIPPGKTPWPVELIAESKGNMQWVIEEGNHQYKLWPHD